MNTENNKQTYNIDFDGGRFDAIAVLDANLPPADVFALFGGTPLLAADGAAIQLHKMGLSPDYIIGDLDTFYGSPDYKDICCGEIIHLPDQESNDFEKVLVFAGGNGYKRILVLGMHGGELEHTLNNWSILMRYAKKIELCVYGRGRYGMALEDSFNMPAKAGEIISLIPQPAATLTTRNLRWGLKEEALELGKREGARNEALAGEIGLTIHSGGLFVFFDSRLPFAPRKTLLNEY